MERNKILEQAKKWLGKNEADGSHREIIDTYNRIKPLARGYKVKYTDSWCATFVSAVAIKCNATEIIPLECSCGKMIEKAQKMGIWVEDDAYTPNTADIIMYHFKDSGVGDNKNWPDHVGIVESVTNNIIKVIEGNIDNAVGYRNIKVNGKTIRGFICPKYTEEQKPVETEEKPVQNGSTVEYYPKYTGTSKSITTALKSLKIDSSKEHRQEIAKANGLPITKDMAEPNEKMLILLKQGKLIKSGSVASAEMSKPVETVKYYARYTGDSNSLVDALKSLKIDSSFNHRKQIAKANKISLYVGLAEQNLKLLILLKQGKLIKE